METLSQTRGKMRTNTQKLSPDLNNPALRYTQRDIQTYAWTDVHTYIHTHDRCEVHTRECLCPTTMSTWSLNRRLNSCGSLLAQNLHGKNPLFHHLKPFWFLRKLHSKAHSRGCCPSSFVSTPFSVLYAWTWELPPYRTTTSTFLCIFLLCRDIFKRTSTYTNLLPLILICEFFYLVS